MADSEDPEGKWAPVKMAADEELNATKLDDLKSALDDLKIVDVNRKPAGLRDDLKVTADFAVDAAAVHSLGEARAFSRPRRRRRPGGILLERGRNSPGDEERRRVRSAFRPDRRQRPAAKDTEKGKERRGKAKESTGLEPLPVGHGRVQSRRRSPSRSSNRLPEPAKAKAAGEEAGREAGQGRQAARNPTSRNRPTDAKALEAERARIEKENKRKQEEYDQQIADGKKKVAELNARFADWYYVISDEVYRKIHLGRDEIVTKKAKKEAERERPPGRTLPASLRSTSWRNSRPKAPAANRGQGSGTRESAV